MKLIFESSTKIPCISETLALLSNGAQIHVEDIQYDETKKMMEILMYRKELIGFRKPLFGIVQPIYNKNVLKTVLRVKNVIEAHVRIDNRLVTDSISSFTVLFGANLDDNELYLGSVEEAQGKPLCEVFAKVNGFSVECIDLED